LLFIFVDDPLPYLNSLSLIVLWLLPDNLLVTIGIVIASLGLSYWILDILFRKAEYA
jgi:hypothetical protein